MELLRLLFLKAGSISWNWAGAYGLRFAALVAAIIGVISAVLAEKYFGQSGGTSKSLIKKSLVGAVGVVIGPVAIWCVLFLISFVWKAPTAVLNKVRADSAAAQRVADTPKPVYRRLGYQEARILIPTILDFPRPCAFRVIAPTENINLRGDFVTLAQLSLQHVPACVLIEPPQDRVPAAFEDHPDYPNGSLVIRAKPSWATQEDTLVTQFRMMGFGRVVHGKALPETEPENFEVVFGTGSLW
jgi:hypothetical protein